MTLFKRLVSIAGLVLSLTGPARAEIITITRPHTTMALALPQGTPLDNPFIHAVDMQCATPVQMKTRIYDVGDMDNLHISILCVAPIGQLGKGDLELAQDPERRQSHFAEVNGCKRALIQITCDHNAPCNGTWYQYDVTCGGPLVYSYPKIKGTIFHWPFP